MLLSEELNSSISELRFAEIEISKLQKQIRYLRAENSELRERLDFQYRKIRELKKQCKR